MAGANYMGGRRNAAKARAKDTHGRIQRSHFGKQRILATGLGKSSISSRNATVASHGDNGVAEIELAHARRGFGISSPLHDDQKSQVSSKTFSTPQDNSKAAIVAHFPASGAKDGSKKTRRSALLRELDISEPIFLRGVMDRIRSLPDLAGLSHMVPQSAHVSNRKRRRERELHCNNNSLNISKRCKYTPESSSSVASSLILPHRSRWRTPPSIHGLSIRDSSQVLDSEGNDWRTIQPHVAPLPSLFSLPPTRASSPVAMNEGQKSLHVNSDFVPMQFDDSSTWDVEDLQDSGYAEVYDVTSPDGRQAINPHFPIYAPHPCTLELRSSSGQTNDMREHSLGSSGLACTLGSSPSLNRPSPHSALSGYVSQTHTSESFALSEFSTLCPVPQYGIQCPATPAKHNFHWENPLMTSPMPSHHASDPIVSELAQHYLSPPCHPEKSSSFLPERPLHSPDPVNYEYRQLVLPLLSAGSQVEECLGDTLRGQLFEGADPWNAVKIRLGLQTDALNTGWNTDVAKTCQGLDELKLAYDRSGVGFMTPTSVKNVPSDPVMELLPITREYKTGWSTPDASGTDTTKIAESVSWNADDSVEVLLDYDATHSTRASSHATLYSSISPLIVQRISATTSQPYQDENLSNAGPACPTSSPNELKTPKSTGSSSFKTVSRLPKMNVRHSVTPWMAPGLSTQMMTPSPRNRSQTSFQHLPSANSRSMDFTCSSSPRVHFKSTDSVILRPPISVSSCSTVQGHSVSISPPARSEDNPSDTFAAIETQSLTYPVPPLRPVTPSQPSPNRDISPAVGGTTKITPSIDLFHEKVIAGPCLFSELDGTLSEDDE